jgi:hypothetical protein
MGLCKHGKRASCCVRCGGSLVCHHHKAHIIRLTLRSSLSVESVKERIYAFMAYRSTFAFRVKEVRYELAVVNAKDMCA